MALAHRLQPRLAHQHRLATALATALAAALAGAACGPETAPPDPRAAPAVEALAAAARDGDAAAISPLLAADALVIDGDARFTARADGAAALAGAGLAVRSAVDSHHDVLRALVAKDIARGDDGGGGEERMLFGRLDADGRLALVVLAPLPGDGDGTDGGDVTDAYQAAWNDEDAAARAAHLEASWDGEGRYVDPTADVTTREALAAHIAAFRDSLPGAAVTGTSAVVERAGMVHFRWVTTGLFGAVNLEGMDVGIVGDDGKLELIAGFFGRLE